MPQCAGLVSEPLPGNLSSLISLPLENTPQQLSFAHIYDLMTSTRWIRLSEAGDDPSLTLIFGQA